MTCSSTVEANWEVERETYFHCDGKFRGQFHGSHGKSSSLFAGEIVAAKPPRVGKCIENDQRLPRPEFGTCIARKPAGSNMETSVLQLHADVYRRLVPPSGLGEAALSGIAQSGCPVLIAGERGTGKRSLASMIHSLSPRSEHALIELQAAEANADTILCALSSKGSLYLSEIGDLSHSLQELIVKTLSDRGKRRTGRLLCGTSHDLRERVRSWRVREDFYYLVSTVSLQVSPLRFRKAEILGIADKLLTEYCKDFACPKPVLNSQVIDYLLEHDWPGNLLELQTALKTLVAIGDQSVSIAALKASAVDAQRRMLGRNISLKQAARSASSQVERKLISDVLVATGGNRKRAANELGISYKTLLYKLKHATGHLGPGMRRNGAQL